MELQYDDKAEAVYIQISDIKPYFGIIARTQELTEDVLVDWMKDGTLYGIDITNVKSKPVVNPSLKE